MIETLKAKLEDKWPIFGLQIEHLEKQKFPKITKAILLASF